MKIIFTMLKLSRGGWYMSVSHQNPGDNVPPGSNPVASFDYYVKVRVGDNTKFHALPDATCPIFFYPLYIRMISVITDKYPL